MSSALNAEIGIPLSRQMNVLEPSPYHHAQLIVQQAIQLPTKALANLHRRALALMRESQIQTIYLCNVYPFCLSLEIFCLFWPRHRRRSITRALQTPERFIKARFPFSKIHVFKLSWGSGPLQSLHLAVLHPTPTPHPTYSISIYSLFIRGK